MVLVRGQAGHLPLLDLVGDESGEGILGGGADEK